MRLLALLLIRAYQRWISPYKGFCCAYRRHTGLGSCSALGYRAIRRHGVFSGLGILRERTWRCGVANRRHGPASMRPLAAQRGDCDCDCGAFDGCDACDIGDFCDLPDCCDCDWPERKKKKQDEKAVHIPSFRGKSGRT